MGVFLLITTVAEIINYFDLTNNSNSNLWQYIRHTMYDKMESGFVVICWVCDFVLHLVG